MRFKSKRGPKRRKKKKTHFGSQKAYFFFLLFSINPVPLHFKDDF
jgi:hypothetical protein